MKVKWRKHIRSTLEISMKLLGKITSLSQNISKSGMLCRTSKKIEELTLLDIKFQIPSSKSYTASKTWVECSGVVVRCEKKDPEKIDMPYEVAIFFDKISERNRALLANYVEGDG